MKLARFTVRYRTILIIIFALATGWAFLHLDAAPINYDLTSYLSENTDTSIGLRRMMAAFEETSSFRVALDDSDDGSVSALAQEIGKLPGVMSAAFDPEKNVTEDGKVWRLIEVMTTEAGAAEAYDAAEALLADTPHLSAGGVKDGRIIEGTIFREMPGVMIVSCLIVLLVLLVMTHSWIQPFLFYIIIGVSIILNMGTNLVFPSISFITFAVAAILQLALAMDYSIMLLNAYDRELAKDSDAPSAMVKALAATYMPVLSSSLTTVAGMLSLVTMSFTIGYDIGMVLAKGIVISMLTVFFLMPGLLVLLTPLMRKTAHSFHLRLRGDGIVRLLRGSRGGVAVLLIVLIAAGAAVQFGNTYTYTVSNFDAESAKLNRLFGNANQIALIYPGDESDEDYARERDLLERLSKIEANGKPVLKETFAMTTTGAMAVEMYDAAKVAKLLNMDVFSVSTASMLAGIRYPVRGDKLIEKVLEMRGTLSAFAGEDQLAMLDQVADLLGTAKQAFRQNGEGRAVVTLDINSTDPARGRVIGEIKAALRDVYGDGGALTGMMVATNDIADSFEGDVRRVTFLTIGAIFLIILFSFRSFLIPAMLVLVIQGAVWLNMAVSGLLDGSIFFMCYLICMALQMGATIDYGILLTTHYRALRAELEPWDAVSEALTRSLPTLMTSGLALVIAGFTVGCMSSVFYISSIGIMLGRGALASLALVILLLPCLLRWADRWVKPRGSK